MKTKFKFLIKQSLNKKVKTKWFKIANLVIAILLIGIFNIDKIISVFGGDFDDIEYIYVIDKLNAYDEFENIFNNTAKTLDMKNYKIENTNESEEVLINDLKDDNKIILVISYDDVNYLNSKVISYNEVSSITSQLLTTTLTTLKSSIVAKENNFSEEQLYALSSPANIDVQLINPSASNKDMLSVGVIMIIIVPCFLLITLLVQMIGAEVNDEKTTRSMEIIISNVSPKVHFSSKIVASVSFVLIQGSLILLYVLIAYIIRILMGGSRILIDNSEISNLFISIKNMGILNTLMKGLPIILILFIFSFLSYAIVSGVLASMTTSTEDFQQLQTPLMIILVLGYYLSLMASTFEGSLFIKIVSYVPMLSFLISPTLYLLGQVSLIELFITTIISGVFTIVIFKYGLRIYKVGILNYSSENLWKKIFKSIKEK